jgi:hypothetical protein
LLVAAIKAAAGFYPDGRIAEIFLSAHLVPILKRSAPRRGPRNAYPRRARCNRDPSGKRAMKHLRAIAAALGGEVSGKSVRAPGPGHSVRDRSLSVTPSVTAPNGFLVNSFAGDDPLVCLDYIRAKLGLPEFSPERSRKRATGWQSEPAGQPAKAVTQPPDNARKST